LRGGRAARLISRRKRAAHAKKEPART